MTTMRLYNFHSHRPHAYTFRDKSICSLEYIWCSLECKRENWAM